MCEAQSKGWGQVFEEDKYSLHITFNLVVETVLEKLKDHQSLSNRVQGNTQTDQLTGKEQQGVSQKAL